MIMVHFMATLFHGDIHANCLTYDVCSSYYSFLDIVSAKLLSMIYMYLGFGKVGFL